jgi:membrane fusion protein (multidrug efflux system)
LTLLLNGCARKSGSEAAGPPPPPDVEVITVVQKDITIFGEWVSTLDGYVNANIQPQVSGYLLKQDYREGSFVQKDQILFEIDPRPFQATLDQAKGQAAQARGQLAQGEAQLKLAQINVNRDRPLAEAHAIAQSQFDNDVQTQAADEAVIKTNQASIQSAEANVEQAELNLGFTKVRSLISGIAGLAQTQIGNLVSTTTVLTTVSQVDPIKAYFPLSEQQYLQFSAKAKPGAAANFLQRSNTIPLQMSLNNGTVYPHPGRFVFADRQVNSQTGTIQVAAAFPNPGNLLRPGEFGRIRARTGVNQGALLVPQKCVTELQGRYQVAVVTPDNKVSIRNVLTGDRVGSDWIIKSGVKAGDRVVSEGLEKVRDGSAVNPKPDTSKPAPISSDDAGSTDAASQ